MGANPIISVITVVYNGKATIEETIRSILNQSDGFYEYIVVDGASTDGTLEIVAKYKDNITRIISEPDKGIYDAMNKGVALSRGEWIIFMNSGDQFASNDVLRTFSAANLSQADVVYGDALISYNTFKRLHRHVPLQDFWKGMPFSHQACFVRRKVFEGQPFNTQYKLSSDFDFLYRAYLNKRRFLYLPVLVCNFDYTGGASVNHATQSIRERKEIVLGYRFSLKAWLYYSCYVQYVVWSGRLKNVLGKRFTEWIIKSVKR
jgi:glycosyltransferase involved in cell wall biosynthesis